MTVPALIRRAEALGLRKIVITDHLNNFDRLEPFSYIKSDIDAVEAGIEVFFGAELSFLSPGGGFACNQKIKEDFGFEVLIGGVHSAYTESCDADEIIRIQHEHFVKTLENPLIDVLVHPFWFPSGEVLKRPPEFWERLIDSVPDAFVRELAEKSALNSCAVEVNPKAFFFNPNFSARFKENYVRFLGRLNEEGAVFAAGSDAHDINDLGKSFYAEGVLHGLGVPSARLWEPSKKGRKIQR